MKIKTFLLACVAVVTAIVFGPPALAALTELQRERITQAVRDRDVGDTIADAADLEAFLEATGSTISGTTNYNTTKAELLAAHYFPVNTSAPGGATLDIDFFDDAAPEAKHLGTTWDFIIVTGGSALTVTAGASGVTTVTTINTTGATCEDAGDTISCQLRSVSAATCTRVCAD